jgi:hypothetical protein
MTSDKECEAYARDYARLANLVADDEIRVQLLKLASWSLDGRGHARTARACGGPVSQSKLDA